MHPAIEALEEHLREVDELAAWLRGADFADERGFLPPEESARFARERLRYPWRVALLRAHEDRVRLDLPEEYAAWVAAGLEAASVPAEVRRWRERGGAARPTWRLDRIEHPPRGDAFEMELRVTWRVTEVATGRVALEVEGCESLEYEGPGWRPSGRTGAEYVRIEGDRALALMVDGAERAFEL